MTQKDSSVSPISLVCMCGSARPESCVYCWCKPVDLDVSYSIRVIHIGNGNTWKISQACFAFSDDRPPAYTTKLRARGVNTVMFPLLFLFPLSRFDFIELYRITSYSPFLSLYGCQCSLCCKTPLSFFLIYRLISSVFCSHSILPIALPVTWLSVSWL